MEENNRPGEDSQAERGATRRAYSTPRLIEYGSAAKLTKGTRSVQFDGTGGQFKRSCL